MRRLQAVWEEAAIQDLVNKYYSFDQVEGFASGVHRDFIYMYRTQYESSSTVNQILESGEVPARWAEECRSLGFLASLSPIYIVIYINVDEDFFRSDVVPDLPDTVGQDHLLLIERIDPFVGIHDRTRHRPDIEGGISIGSSRFSNLSGTTGFFLRSYNSDKLLALSCNHILLRPNDDIVQQGPHDGGTVPSDLIGTTTYTVPLSYPPSFSFGAVYDKVDASLADLNGGVHPRLTVRLSGSIPIKNFRTVSKLNIGDEVFFVGKESDREDARIYRWIARLKVKHEYAYCTNKKVEQNVKFNFGDLIEIEPRVLSYLSRLARPGDSGSLLICDDIISDGDGKQMREACGLLLAGNKKTALCCFIEYLINDLNNLSDPKHSDKFMWPF